MLDEFRCHMQSSFLNMMGGMGTDIEIIPGGYTCVLQVLDVGINRQFKHSIRNAYLEWVSERLESLPNDAQIPVPERQDMAIWIDQNWKSAVTAETIVKTFDHIGLKFN